MLLARNRCNIVVAIWVLAIECFKDEIKRTHGSSRVVLRNPTGHQPDQLADCRPKVYFDRNIAKFGSDLKTVETSGKQHWPYLSNASKMKSNGRTALSESFFDCLAGKRPPTTPTTAPKSQKSFFRKPHVKWSDFQKL